MPSHQTDGHRLPDVSFAIVRLKNCRPTRILGVNFHLRFTQLLAAQPCIINQNSLFRVLLPIVLQIDTGLRTGGAETMPELPVRGLPWIHAHIHAIYDTSSSANKREVRSSSRYLSCRDENGVIERFFTSQKVDTYRYTFRKCVGCQPAEVCCNSLNQPFLHSKLSILKSVQNGKCKGGLYFLQ